MANLIHRESLSAAKKDEFILGAMWKFHERAWTFTVSKELHSFVHAKGLLPFVSDPTSVVQRELAEIQKNLGIPRDEAINFLRSRFTQPEGAENGEMG
jgi:hypothetical protein